MAGSFNFFRQYQKLALAALAIMAMLAFFVLPPILQMGSGGGVSTDRQVVGWKGGGLTETGLQREMITRRALNQFLMALRVAATGEERVQPPLPEGEAAVVETLVLAKEAQANGLVVSDTVVNNFLSTWTGDMVTAERIEGVIDQLRSRVGVSEGDIFDSLRSLMLARYVQELAIRGVDANAAPAGWQWDDFRRLEQGATVELVPVVAEQLADQVAAPTSAAVEAVYEQYKDDLPRARSATPGFKDPARLRYDMLVASADMLVAESAKAVTDEAIEKFYEENKESLFAIPADDAAPPAPEATSVEPEIKPAADPAAAGQPAPEVAPEPKAVSEETTNGAGETAEPPAEAGSLEIPAADPAEPPAGDSSRQARLPVQTVSFLKQADPATPEESQEPEAGTTDQAAPPAEAAMAPAPEAAPPAAGEGPAEPTGGAEASSASTMAAGGSENRVKPLADVRDEIRGQLAREAADRRLGEMFDTIAGRIATYAEELDLAIALGNKPPAAPDLEAIASEFGLDSLRSEFVTAADAVAAGGVGTSFQLSFSERFGVRQQRWIDMVFSPEFPRWRPLVTRDVAGNRYLSWKTEERPEFTPPLADIRPEVERVCRLMEARPLARKRAEQVVAAAAGKPLSEAVAGQAGLEATSAGPFTWLTRGTAPFGSVPMLSDPDGVQMAGEEFMKAVFSLEPGGTAVAFNEPQTVCYAIRLASLEPDEAALQQRFLDAAGDPRRLAAVAEGDVRAAYARWLEDVSRRQGVEWKRPPR